MTMELSNSIFTYVLSPLAIFRDDTGVDVDSSNLGDDAHNLSHVPQHLKLGGKEKAVQNTKTWRLDGIDVDGSRFFAVPLFALNSPPLRVDVYIPPLDTQSPATRHRLKSDAVIYTTDRDTALSLPISRHILRALDHWSSNIPDFAQQYLSLPFGSQVVITDLSHDLVETASSIQLVPNYAVEQAMTSLDVLQNMWASGFHWPGSLDTTDLCFHSQIHEAITLVTVPSSPDPSRLYVFKSLLRDQKYLYNELKMLLSLPPHPNLISRPVYIITHKCRFGGKRGVAGFILEYCPLGSLAAHLPNRTSCLSDRFRWARQVTSALIHVNDHGGFYPDLKPDNIVLRKSSDGETVDAVLLDLEQRGGWFSWSPPEVAYVEYIEILASRAPDADMRRGLPTLLRQYIPGWTPAAQEQRYQNVDGGFSAPWLALAAQRTAGGDLASLLERAQTFMLGKLLWCIFEGRSVVRCGIDHEMLRDADPEFGGRGAFPQFAETPAEVRELIRACTSGAPEWAGRERGLVLRDGRLVPASWDGEGEVPSAEETREVARKWWGREVERAKDFLVEVTRAKMDGQCRADGVLGMAMRRPLLREVLAQLMRIEEKTL